MLFELLTTSAVAMASYVLYQYWRWHASWVVINRIPGPTALPIIGNAHQIGFAPEDIYKNLFRLWREFSCKTFRLRLGYTVYVMISTPEEMETVLTSSVNIRKHDVYNMLRPWLGTGLLTSTGIKWHRRRKIITPAFHFKILDGFISVFESAASTLVSKMAANVDGEDFDVYPYVSACSLDAICETAMGIKVNAQSDIDSEYSRAVRDICAILHKRMFSAFTQSELVFALTLDSIRHRQCLRTLHALTNEVIAQRKKELKDKIASVMSSDSSDALSVDDDVGAKKRLAFLDLLLLSKDHDGKPLDDESLSEETNTFMFEGHDTTASGLSFLLYCLSMNPDVQQTAYQEQIAIFGNELDGQVTNRQLQDMRYLERVIKESLRIYPSVPMTGRRLVEDVTLPDGNFVPKGGLLTLGVMFIHMNEKYYPEPHRFDPDRFLPENAKDRHPFAYIPFSAGPRNCIGQKFVMMEMKIVASKLLRNYKMVAPSPDYKPILEADITLKSVNGIQIRLTRRTN